jgi:hypothetical protein
VTVVMVTEEESEKEIYFVLKKNSLLAVIYVSFSFQFLIEHAKLSMKKEEEISIGC